MSQPQHDPGWEFDWRILVPGLQRRAFCKAAGAGAVAQLRMIFFSFCSSLVLFGVVLLLLAPADAEDPLDVGVALGIVAAIAVAGYVVGGAIGRLDGSSAEALRASYRSRFFVRIATSHVAVLAGFVLTFLADSDLPYFFALLVAAPGYHRAAPTNASLQKDQDALNATGAPADLRGALR